ncbi:P-loop containing nucleoside triphosphate hydrolase protein [Scheffersomyces coipomensis]|uniref:P-loop containing nucleoside triphosphate hydrolase protein n=1 Tax=Scheffersomyces coipomensis TaxID=1788519 RepID=UPI00315D0127
MTNEGNNDKLHERLLLPLAEAIRPQSLTEYIGQSGLINTTNGEIWNFIRLGYLPSMILYGPPGVGKTTIASLIAEKCGYIFTELSATDTTIAELKDLSITIERENAKRLDSKDGQLLKIVIFIDEIHRFSTKQQDFLLPYVESGNFVFIGATTINPHKRIRRAILSRCQIFQLNLLTSDEIMQILKRAMLFENIRRKHLHKLRFLSYDDDCLNLIINYAQGDTRIGIGLIELISTKFATDVYKYSGGSEPVSLNVIELKDSIKSLRYSLQGLQDESNLKIFKSLFDALRCIIPSEEFKQDITDDGKSSDKPTAKATKDKKDEEVTLDYFLDDFKSRYIDPDDKDYEYLHQMQVSDDSDIEEGGDIYGCSTSEVKLIDPSKSSTLEHFQLSAVFYTQLLLKRGESPIFIGKQLILFTILYVKTDVFSLRKILNALKAVKYSNANVDIVLSNCVEWLTKQPKLILDSSNDIKRQLQWIKRFHKRQSNSAVNNDDDTLVQNISFDIDYDSDTIDRLLHDVPNDVEGVDQNPGFVVKSFDEFKDDDDFNIGKDF